jgi:hypothetical protein
MSTAEPKLTLKVPTESEWTYLKLQCDEHKRKVGVVRAEDFKDYEAVLLDPARSPVRHMEVENQRRSDCQGQSLANGEESRRWKITGTMPDLSEMYAYIASLYIMAPRNVGVDDGSSIQSGVRLLTEGIPSLKIPAGLPTIEAWPYNRWCSNASQFQRYCQNLQVDKSVVVEAGEMLPWKDALASLAAGASIHIGTYWNVQWKPFNGKRLMTQLPRPGGGHATEIIWAERINGVWYMIVWNSHNDGWYYMPEAVYTALQRTQCHPFGGYTLYPDRIVERYYDRVAQGGGLFQ